MTNDKDNVNRSVLPPKEREFYSYVRKIVESARYTGNADHEDVPSILRDFEDKIKTEVARKIFAEIAKILTENKVLSDSGIYYEHSVWYDIAKLNDKYTKEGAK